MRRLQYIGIDGWSRPVYKDQDGQLWKDVSLGKGVLTLCSAANNELDGEPDMPITGEYEIIKWRAGNDV